MSLHVETRELQAALEACAPSGPVGRSQIVRLERTPYPYTTSFPLEQLRLFFANGQGLDLLFKNVSPRALSATARRAKPQFLSDPLREIEVYRGLLNGRPLGTAAYYGSVVDESADRYWLFIEPVAGRELYQVGEFPMWKAAARWLAGLHQEFAQIELHRSGVVDRLVRYDAEYYALWPQRAAGYLNQAGDSAGGAADRLFLWLGKHYGQIIQEMLALPTSLLHGEFYASNILVQGLPPAVRVCAVDWECAAIGPGLVDLAAFIAGNWNEEDRRTLALEYFGALESDRAGYAGADDFMRGLNLCRLHVALQWLGWSPDWSPPPEHRQNWLAEAEQAAELLGYTQSSRPDSSGFGSTKSSPPLQ